MKQNARASKIDIAICNPPYCRDLHLRIIEKLIPHCEEVLNISPISWLQDPLAKYKKNSSYNKFKESVAEHIADLEVIDAKKCQALFDALFIIDLGIYHFDNNKHKIVCKYPQFMSRVAKYMKDSLPPIEHLKKDGYRVRIMTIGGGKAGGSGQRSATLFSKNPLSKNIVYKDGMYEEKPWHSYYVKNQYSKTTDEITDSIKFDSEYEAYNFIHSYDTVFAKIVHLYSVTGVNINKLNILWMKDYTQPWTDERFKDYFNITDEEWKEIEEIMSKYK